MLSETEDKMFGVRYYLISLTQHLSNNNNNVLSETIAQNFKSQGGFLLTQMAYLELDFSPYLSPSPGQLCAGTLPQMDLPLLDMYSWADCLSSLQSLVVTLLSRQEETFPPTSITYQDVFCWALLCRIIPSRRREWWDFLPRSGAQQGEQVGPGVGSWSFWMTAEPRKQMGQSWDNVSSEKRGVRVAS